ncbi:MAG: polysaccharide deacetylase family protein [Anaerolineales bacterium]|nr:polysaccharide deacetylase family protein [Anaerolineales bacterium]
MNPNPYLKKLGFSDRDRLVIIHTDDIGMCHASVAAYAHLVDFGIISSAATMVPCPWFPAVADFCRQNPQADMGVHATLNSEWDLYRWGPISTRDTASGLIDEEGYLHRTTSAVHAQASPAAVQAELAAQVQRALAAGIDVTHVDTHMGTVGHPRLIPIYVQVALQFGLPPMIPRLDESGFLSIGMDQETARFAAQSLAAFEDQGIPLIDHVAGAPLDQPDNRMQVTQDCLDQIPAGITHFVIHPSIDTPELHAIAPDWRSRLGDYQNFCNEEMRRFLQQRGVHVIGYRLLRDAMRAR